MRTSARRTPSRTSLVDRVTFIDASSATRREQVAYLGFPGATVRVRGLAAVYLKVGRTGSGASAPVTTAITAFLPKRYTSSRTMGGMTDE